MIDPIQRAINMVLPRNGVQTPTPFRKILPYNSVVKRPLVEQFAYSQVDPEVNRQRSIAYDDLMSGLASSGGLRFGTSGQKQNRLYDNYSRLREEMALPFVQEGMGRLSDYYNELEREYYMDPNAFEYKPMRANRMLSDLYGVPMPGKANPTPPPGNIPPSPISSPPPNPFFNKGKLSSPPEGPSFPNRGALSSRPESPPFNFLNNNNNLSSPPVSPLSSKYGSSWGKSYF